MTPDTPPRRTPCSRASPRATPTRGSRSNAAESEVTILAQSLEGCVATSCASTCPGAGGGHYPTGPTNDDASAANDDAGTTSDDAGATNDDAGSGNGTGTSNGTGPGSGSGWNGFPDSGTDDAGGNPHSWW